MNNITKPKKIDVIVKYFFPVTAGIEVNVMETYKRMAKQGFDVTIHTSTDVYLQKNILPRNEVIQGLKVKRYPFKWFGYFPDIDYKNTDLVALHNFDIFPHLHILVKVWFMKLFNKKNFVLVITPHGGYNPEWRVFTGLQAFIKKNYHYVIANKLINLTTDGMRAVSEWEKREMILHGIHKKIVEVIMNGIEDEAYTDVEKLASKEIKEKVESFGKYIIQIGRIYKIKNYETSIRALSLLPQDVNYIIAGPQQDTETYKLKLETLIKELGLGKRVHFIGVVKGVDKYYLIRKAQLMIHMAIWESYCNVVHEGLSQGLPCIVANNTALPFLIKDGINGYCVETYDYKKVGERMNYVLKNKKSTFIKEMEERNRKEGLKTSWENVSYQLGAWYSKLIQNYDKSN